MEQRTKSLKWKRCSNPNCRARNEAELTRDDYCSLCGSELVEVKSYEFIDYR